MKLVYHNIHNKPKAPYKFLGPSPLKPKSQNFSGCSVFAYDHTISAPAQRGKNIKFFKTGLGIGEHLETLKNLIKANRHEATTIDYLKVDFQFRFVYFPRDF